MLKKYFFLLIIVGLLLKYPGLVSAHILKTDGYIGAVLHIDPDDDPIVNKQTGFFFEFKDKQNKFTPQNCNCTFSISEDNKEIFSQPLFQNSTSPSLDSASLFFTFPEKNVYQLKVTGQPNTPDAFQKFTLVYDIRVAREDSTPQQTVANSSGGLTDWIKSHVIHLVGGFLVLGFLIFVLVKQSRSKVKES